MRVLLIAYFYSVPDSVGALRPRAMARHLRAQGFQVTVLTLATGRDSVDPDVIGVKDISRASHFVAVLGAWRLWQAFWRVLGFFRSPTELWLRGIRRQMDDIVRCARPDIVLASYPPSDALEAGLLVAQQAKVPLVVDFRDGLLLDSMESSGWTHWAMRQKHVQLQQRTLRTAALVLTVSEPLARHFRSASPTSDVLLLPNGFEANEIVENPPLDMGAGLLQLVHTGRLDASRPGTSGTGHGIGALANALDVLIERLPGLQLKLRVHFVGLLTLRERRLLARHVTTGLVRLWGHHRRPVALGFQRKADWLLLIAAPDASSVATGKLFEYLAAERPIVALAQGSEAERIIAETGTGLTVASNDSLAIADLLERVLSDEPNVLPARRPALIANYAWDVQMKFLADQLRRLGKSVAGNQSSDESRGTPSC